MFNINTDRLIEMLLSPRLIASAFLCMLKSILQPVKSLVLSINSYRTATELKLSFNGQVCSLERLLNDRFDPTERNIYITDAESIHPLIAYPSEDVDRRIIITDSPVIAYNESVIGDNMNKFIVNIQDSNELRAIESQIIATVQLYKLSGKVFIIKFY